MVEEIKIKAYLVKCDGFCCNDYLVIPNKEIHLNLGDEIKSQDWFLKNGKHYCKVCGK